MYYSKIFFLNIKGSSDDKVVSLTEKEYGSQVHFFLIFIKSISDE